MARQPQAASIASLLESWGEDGKNDSQNFIWENAGFGGTFSPCRKGGQDSSQEHSSMVANGSATM